MSNQKKTIGTNPFGVSEKSKSLLTRAVMNRAKEEGLPGILEELEGAVSEFNEETENLGKNAHKLEKQTNHASTSAKQLTGHSVSVSQALEKAKETARKMSGAVNSSAKSALAALKFSDTTNSRFTSFIDSSKELDKLDKVVANLAQQINIFALNASIEAARSGEAGRGFTVVANEIKELSRETFKVSEEIRNKIDSFFSDARDAINTMNEISNLVLAIKNSQTAVEEELEEQYRVLDEASKNAGGIIRSSNSVTDNILNVYKLAKLNTESVEKIIRISHAVSRVKDEFKQNVQSQESNE
ncbi:MAG TPA: methyl-accepting chemotaxis protein [Leptospiraceae bacterium]|nr:methyl-accepting chemotaxis protein [Leptospiraceae bacterium]HMY69478.1 methyl-accepting chemotaxis protein [Leptospiraceae bacterium]HNF13001.1 methyl-accepting chemotaxis protein [Leptospiraceae bacterium]HNI98347.1 methyl-accepting chemotaxis protein [Leptospiraceae bacterium]HNM01838.1 methyl-accepting chemotaxis protein [Leptospiraceae bacterium]